MATGDLRNNLARLQAALRAVRYPLLDSLDWLPIAQGDPHAFLPLLHHVLLDFDPAVTRHLTSTAASAPTGASAAAPAHAPPLLRARRDAGFVAAAFRVLRDTLGCKPRLAPAQFLADGFAERKVLLVADAAEK
ncbi:Centrosomal protein of 44 kDa [Cladochytrium tenue]|nr:Centrosomal protein of 44 kDa [Cladochytrium tenue]